MHRFSYPNDKPIFVTDDTIKKTPYSFDVKHGISEPTSIQYFFSLLTERNKEYNAMIVDVGAQTGLYSLYARFLPECRFYAFEPFHETYTILCENLKENGIENVKTFPYALGSKEEKKHLHIPDHLGLNTFGNTPQRFDSWKDVEVEVKCLDDILKDETAFDFMKCDVEGWEYHVLKGAEESIQKWKPELFIEVCDRNLKQCEIKKEDLYDYLHFLGYKQKNVVDDENVHFSFCDLNNPYE